MEVLYARCCGLDVHQSRVGGMREHHRELPSDGMKLVPLGRRPENYFSCESRLVEVGCTHVAMESTGVLWRPVTDRLVGYVELILVTALASEAGTGAQDGRAGCRVACGSAATRPPDSQLCT